MTGAGVGVLIGTFSDKKAFCLYSLPLAPQAANDNVIKNNATIKYLRKFIHNPSSTSP